MFLFVGLGNPGSEYANTRHNIGFMAVDEIIRRYNFSVSKSKFKGLLSDGLIGRHKVLVLKPETYMNLSGASVLSAMSFYKIKPEDIYVFQDDMDLKLGKVRIKKGGSSGGHNGIKSIDNMIGSGYNRIRIGVGRAEKIPVTNYVLGSFGKEEQAVKEKVLEIITENVEILLDKGNDKFSGIMGEELKNGI